MEIIELPIKALKPYKRNPRKNDKAVEYVANSIRQFGFKVPIVIDENYEIVCGHTRWKAAKVIGLESVPCIMADDLNEDQIRAFRLADNKTAEMADWDFDLLEMEFGDIDPALFDMADFGFFQDDETEDKAPTEVTEDDFDETTVTEAVCKRGQVWKLGEHRLMCGDSTSAEDVTRLMNGEKADMVFTDPPYQLQTEGGGILKTSNSMRQIKQNGVDNFNPSVLKLYAETNIFCHNKPLIKEYIELAEKNKMPYDLTFYKKKNTAPNYKGHLMTDVEYIAIIGKQDPNKGLEKEIYSKCFIGQKDNGNELSYSKPVALCGKYVQLFSKKTVLDLFGGSGSTLIACEQLDRRCFMMEISEHYCDVIIRRWEDFTGQKAELLEE